MDDSDVAYALPLLKKLRLQVHIRGTDDRPVIELTDKGTGSVIGGIELKRRMREWG